MRYSALTDIGKVRQTNEDAFFISEVGGVFAVADGMGGHHCGEVASQLAITTVEKYSHTLMECPEEEIIDNLNQIANDVFFLISARVSEDELCAKMGTTIVVAVVRNNKLFYAHLGDSRLYLLRNKVLSRVTHDHSVVQELVDAKVITEVEALTHPMRNMVTRVLADGSEYIPDTNSIDLYSGDKLLLCTDGLCGVIDDETIKNKLIPKNSPDEICKSLINISLESGGNDNITVITVEYNDVVVEAHNIQPKAIVESHWKNGLTALLSALALFLVVYIVAGFIFKKYIIKVNPLTRNLAIFEYHPLIPFMPNKMVESSNISENEVSNVNEYLLINFADGKTVGSIEDGKAFLREVEDSIKMQIKQDDSLKNNKVDKDYGIGKASIPKTKEKK